MLLMKESVLSFENNNSRTFQLPASTKCVDLIARSPMDMRTMYLVSL